MLELSGGRQECFAQAPAEIAATAEIMIGTIRRTVETRRNSSGYDAVIHVSKDPERFTKTNASAIAGA